MDMALAPNLLGKYAVVWEWMHLVRGRGTSECATSDWQMSHRCVNGDGKVCILEAVAES